MPGDPEFTENVKSEQGVVLHTGDLVGRVMALDLTQRRAWQCGGFSVSMNSPVSTVSTMTVQRSIRQALLEGILIDITDQPDKGLHIKGSRTTAATIEDTGRKVFITVDRNGGMAVMSPKDDAQQLAMDESVNNGDVVIPDNPEIATMSPAARFRVKPQNISEAMDAFTTKFKV